LSGNDSKLAGARPFATVVAMTSNTRKCLQISAWPAATVCLLLIASCLTGCATHQFTEPTRDWQSRNGQLLYRTKSTTLIGEVLVRFSTAGEFELTFSKGPGVTLLTLKQDAIFAQVRGGLARGGWSGPIANAPPRLRGWLQLRDELAKAPKENPVRYSSGGETFIFRF
jgi:hypothetical protein